jgi:glycosyltransferase involved in cell wall biosynthesis
MSTAGGRRTRLCIVTPYQTGGGAEYQIDLLINALHAVGRYEISFLVRHPASQAMAQGRYRLVKIGQGDKMPWLGYAADFRPLYLALAHLEPDVIYQRVACGYTGVCAYYARRKSARLIWHVAHDTDVTQGGLGYGRNPLRQLLERRCVEFGIRYANHIVVQKEQQAALLARHYGRRADAVIPNFHPEPAEVVDKSGPLTVLWIANLKRWKRPEAFVRLAQSLSDLSGVRFVMVGAPAYGDAWRDELMSSIARTDNLEYVGLKTQAEVNDMLARAHVFVNTSVQEGFPNTFIQAWMRSVPVVSLDVNPDNVLDQASVGIHAGSEPAMAQAVRSLLTDEALRMRFAERARQFALSRHSVRNADRLISLIDTGRAESPPQ